MEGDGNPKLWVALSRGRVVVFDAASWSMLQDCIQVGNSQLVRTHADDAEAACLIGLNGTESFRMMMVASCVKHTHMLTL